jgi:hypothetical protein
VELGPLSRLSHWKLQNKPKPGFAGTKTSIRQENGSLLPFESGLTWDSDSTTGN